MSLDIKDVAVMTPAGGRLKVVRVAHDYYRERIAVYVELPDGFAPEPAAFIQPESKTPIPISPSHRDLLIAMGLLSTLHPSMEIDVTDPIGMAKKIHAYVTEKMK